MDRCQKVKRPKLESPINENEIRFTSQGLVRNTTSVIQDRISQLPDEILVFILSFLRLKEAAVTSVLSRRWTGLWLFRTHLVFDATVSLGRKPKKLIEMERRRYVKGVNQVLKLYMSPTVEEFKIGLDLDKKFKRDIDEWIKFALARRVQRLELDLSWDGLCFRDSRRFYTFPFKLLDQTKRTYKSRNLPSSFCSLRGCISLGLKSLKSLSLKCVKVSGEVLDYFLSNCPVLERLSVCLSKSKELVNLKVAGSSLVLKYLEICHCCYIKSIEICNVNLVTLIYEGHYISVALMNVPQLVELSISGGLVYKYLKDFLPRFSCCFSRLETLTLAINSKEGFSGFHGSFELTNLKKLLLTTYIGDDISLLGYTCLIKASPFLQKFVLQAKWMGGKTTISEREVHEAVRWSSSHQHLEEVELAGYFGRKSDLELVVYFLENAVALKKFIVRPSVACTPRSPKDMYTIEEEKAALWRAKKQLEGKFPRGIELMIL